MTPAEIRDSRLYREEFETFEGYCKERWDFSRPRAYQLIEASVAVDAVSTIVDIQPANEAQARPLTQLETPEEQIEEWEMGIKKQWHPKIYGSN